MKLLLQKAFGIFVVLFFGFLAYIALNLVMFSANLRDPNAAFLFYSILCVILVCTVRGLVTACKDETYRDEKKNTSDTEPEQ